MDKNTITGFILIALVVIGFSWYSQPSREELEAMAQRDSIAAVEQQKQAEAEQANSQTLTATSATPDSSALFFSQLTGEGQRVLLQNEKVKVGINSKGAVVEDAEIIGYKSRRREGDVVILGKEDASMRLTLPLKQQNLCLADLCFNIAEQTDSSVTFVAEQGEKQLLVRYILRPDSYMLDMEIASAGMEGMTMPGASNLLVEWVARIPQQEKGADFENRYSSLTYKRQEKSVKQLSETSDESKKPEEALEWIAFKNQFFSAVLIGSQPMTQASLSTAQLSDEKDYLKRYEASFQVPFDATGKDATQLQMYLGPNDFHVLQAHSKMTAYGSDADLDELVYLGWSFFRFINRWSILYIFDWLKAMGLPMGIVLLLLTVIVKIIVWPTQKKSYMSSAKMRVLKPKLDEITKQYPNPDQAMQKQQAMMQVYSQYGVSPMGGCLPMLIQMPIWLALFNFIPNAIDLRGESFLWADDLSAYDDLIRWDADLWLIGNHLSIFCLLFSATNLINTWISMRQQQNQFTGEQAQQMKMMQWMMYLMPLMFFFMFNNYSSGLSYYYFVSGLLSIITMWYLRWSTDDAKLLASLEAYREQHKNDPKKMSGLQARLEALQKMQQEQQARGRK
ncbi:MAG: membrane protein insertase YidC [Bacteroidaceae bacterium]|jgi:YidC/Oxa1 family membrane protein insertase|nr:membrane protein insertase YidC [Bacteroidaceae bacterium]